MPDGLRLTSNSLAEILVEHFLLKLSKHSIGLANFRVNGYSAANVRIGNLEVHSHPVNEPVRSFLNCLRRVDLSIEKNLLHLSVGIHDEEDRWE